MKLPADKVSELSARYGGVPVCVTGGAGFIGGHLVDALLSLGAKITVIDDLSNSTAEHLAGLIELDSDRVRFVHGSILDDQAVEEAMGLEDGAWTARVVFHLAAVGSVPRSIAEPQRSWSVNSTGTVRVLEAARKVNAARVVYSASSSIYGDAPGLPRVETQAPAPLSPYAASKSSGESAMLAWSRSYGLSTVSLRYFNVFGPRQPADSAYSAVVAAFARKFLAGERPVIYGDGMQSRDFTFVANAVLANLLAGVSERRLAGEALNIGTGSRTTVEQLARMMAALAGSPQIRPEHHAARAGDVPHSQADISLARSTIGYEPVIDLEAGLRETVAWYRSVYAGA